MPGKTSVLFVCSSKLHARLFSRVIPQIAAAGRYTPIMVSLGGYYPTDSGKIATFAERHGMPHETVEFDFHAAAEKSIYRRIEIARYAVLPRIVAFVGERNASLVILGNDTGHAERAVIAAARRTGTPSLLVQDGFYLDPFGRGLAGDLALAVRRAWLQAGGGAIGGVPYGMGGTTAIATHGTFSANIFRRVATSWTKSIEVTGHPFLTIDPTQAVPLPACRTVTFFCTNYLTGLKDRAGHARQISEIKALQRQLAQLERVSPVLGVKLHPADRVGDYSELSAFPGIVLHHASPLSDVISATWLGVTNMSAVVLDCAAMGRVCLMSDKQMPGLALGGGANLSGWLTSLGTDYGYDQALNQQALLLGTLVDGFNSAQEDTRLYDLVNRLIVRGRR